MASPMSETPAGSELLDMERVRVAPPTPVLSDHDRPIHPTDEDERILRARVRAALTALSPVYGLTSWGIRVFYTRQHFRGDYADAAMYVKVQWEYQEASIWVSICDCYDDTWDDVLDKVAHELAHAITEPLRDHAQDPTSRHVVKANELLVTRIARAVVYALGDTVDDPCAVPEAPGETPSSWDAARTVASVMD